MLPVFDVTSAVAVLNQTLEYAYPSMIIVGEISELRVSKGKWLYFDIKDAQSKLKCFGTVYMMKMPLEDGMQVELVAQPRLHNLYGFSMNAISIRPVGEGSIKKAKDKLAEQLEKEGLFALERKRQVPYPPERVALVTSTQSAAYADFIKIITARWPLVTIDIYDVQVQGVSAEEEIIQAIHDANLSAEPAEVLVIIRGGGSGDDLSTFSLETVTRAVAASRIPTVVAIGHEIDISLAELASDMRASTPSNAAELLVPDKHVMLERNTELRKTLLRVIETRLSIGHEQLVRFRNDMGAEISRHISEARQTLSHLQKQINSYHPDRVLARGFVLVHKNGMVIKDPEMINTDDVLELEFAKTLVHVRAIDKKEKEI